MVWPEPQQVEQLGSCSVCHLSATSPRHVVMAKTEVQEWEWKHQMLLSQLLRCHEPKQVSGKFQSQGCGSLYQLLGRVVAGTATGGGKGWGY